MPTPSATFAVVTFGCRVNQADSCVIEESLRAGGAIPGRPDAADVVIVNTCSVTASADQGARQTIRRLARQNPRARIVVTGCYATREPAGTVDLPGVVGLVPNDDKGRVVAIIADALGPSTAARYGDGPGSCGAPRPDDGRGRTCYTLGVQTGCDQPCAYCIIPSTRGRGRSARPEHVLARAVSAEKAGFNEITLTGVHLGSYGRDLSPATSLTELLRQLAGATERVLFRISSLEPMDCPLDLVDLVLHSSRFAPHFHLPLQHGSDRVLRAMHRPYSLGDYQRLVGRIRRTRPDAAIGADVIVGFPGETDQDFDRMAAYLARAPLASLHVFPYSDRPGTPASRLVPKVPGPVIRERGRIVRDIGLTLSARFRASQHGRVRSGLTLADGTLVLTDNYLKVRVPHGCPANRRVRVRVTATRGELTGEIVSGPDA